MKENILSDYWVDSAVENGISLEFGDFEWSELMKEYRNSIIEEITGKSINKIGEMSGYYILPNDAVNQFYKELYEAESDTDSGIFKAKWGRFYFKTIEEAFKND
mgnify:CR=1 FL=1